MEFIFAAGIGAAFAMFTLMSIIEDFAGFAADCYFYADKFKHSGNLFLYVPAMILYALYGLFMFIAYAVASVPMILLAVAAYIVVNSLITSSL